MPLTRYQIRNEYGLADPELYKAADKDDPEALLEGVAMAGLVGVLRQLGDLAEFAAEVFHDLHEEVISTAARGHGLMVRVQQLESEVPSIEKAFLSQTSHTSFFSSTGVGWHPNLQSEQGLIARGDLPRFVMDSYEECRGPPRLFLLDKFDVAGAGACLKRYTDPSVFKVEPLSSERSTIESQREKKIRKVKKKGPRWRNGGTPEIGPTSHTKLQQLFLEERIDNCLNGPSRLVKLKKRHLNGRGIYSNGKSYMEKFLETPSPEHKMVCETSVVTPTLHLMSDNTNELGLKILDITMLSPKNKSPGKVSSCSSCTAQEEVLKSPINGDLSGQESMKMPESSADDEIETTMVENQLDNDDGDRKTESSIDGYRSDEVISEVDNYMDALATMESELETDNEPRSKNVIFLKVGKQESESDASVEHLENRAQLSDLQSFVNSSGSDEGNSSFKRDRFSFSCSDTVSSLVDNMQYDSEGAARSLTSIPKACMVDTENVPCNLDETSLSHEREVNELEVLDNTSVDEDRTPECQKAFDDSSFSDPLPLQRLLNAGSGLQSSMVETQMDETPSTNLVNLDSQTLKIETDLDSYEVVFPDVPSKIINDADVTITSETYPINNEETENFNVMSESLMHPSNDLRATIDTEGVENIKDKLPQSEYFDDKTVDKQPLSETESCPGISLPSETLPNSTEDSSFDDAVLIKGSDDMAAPEVKYENPPLTVDFLQTQHLKDQSVNVIDDVPCVEATSTERDAYFSEREANIVGVTKIVDDREIAAVIHSDATSDQLQFCYLNNTEHKIDINSQDNILEKVHPQGTFSDSAVSSHDELASPGDLDHEDTMNYSDGATEKARTDDVLDTANCSSFAADKVQGDVVESTTIVVDTATVTEVTLNNSVHFSDEEHVHIDYPMTSNDVDVDVDEVVYASLNGLSSKNMDNDSLDNHPGFKVSHPNQNGLEDTSECTAEPVIESKVNQLDVAPTPLDPEDELDSGYSDSQTIDDIHNLPVPIPIPIQAQGIAVVDDVSIGQSSLNLKNLESESNSSYQSDLEEGIKFMSLRPSDSSIATESPKEEEPASDLLAKQMDMELLQADSDVSNSSSLQQSTKIHSPLCLSSSIESSEGSDLQAKPSETEPMESDIVVSNSSSLLQSVKLQSPPLFSSAMKETPKEPLDLQTRHVEIEYTQADFYISNPPSFQQPIKILPLGQLDKEKVDPVQSSDPVQMDQNYDCNGCQGTVQAELSLSQLYIQHPLTEINMTGQTRDALQPLLPCLVLMPEAPQVSLNEMPPLPPLPPMQWRLGKVQQAFPAAHGSENPHPSIPPFKAEEKHIGPSNAENPYFCSPFGEVDKSAHVSGHRVQAHVLPMVRNDDYQYSSETVADTQSINPCFTLPPIPKDSTRHDSIASNDIKEQSDLTRLSLGQTIEDRTCRIDGGSPHGNSLQTLKNSSEEFSKTNTSQCTTQDFEGELRNPHYMIAPPSFMRNGHSQQELPTSEEVEGSSSNMAPELSTSEVGKPNGNPSSKLLRPRSPLIDAVAAHDKSKLRKVSDRILPQNGPKVDERDSLLAQIRTKSFSLKPAVPTRPSVQGPKTNLNVAAILEKANAIRHAFAGSDEDDDTDSWGDSE